MKFIDFDDKRERMTVVDKEDGVYLGHPTTVMLDDKKTIIIVYPKGHGRGPVIMKKSFDRGHTWSQRLDVPRSWETSQEVPTIYKTLSPEGKRYLIMFSGLYPIRMAKSFDEGESWFELAPIGEYGGIVAMADLTALKEPGHYLALFHDNGPFLRGTSERENLQGCFTVYGVRSTDGGLSWSEPEALVSEPELNLCEPCLIRSPDRADGAELAMLLRENSRRKNSLICFSQDEGHTWSKPQEMHKYLCGDRHQHLYTASGKLLITFRGMSRETDFYGDFAGWYGSWDDLKSGAEGQTYFRLIDNHHGPKEVMDGTDSTYPALELLPDGTIFAVTYGHWTSGEMPYIMGIHFKEEELC